MREIKDSRVALLVDTDNVSDRYAEDIVKIAAESGNVIVRRGYGVINPFKWEKDIMLRYAILPVTMFVSVPKKNVTDIALIIDALDMVYRKIVDVVCIASNDSDFSLLAMKLREYSVEVHGIGNDHAQLSFVSSCDKFHYLDKIDKDKEEQQEMLAEDKPASVINVDLEKVLLDAYNRCDDDDGWVLAKSVATYIRRMDSGFSPRTYGHRNFSELVKSTGLFVYDDSEKANHKIKVDLEKVLLDAYNRCDDNDGWVSLVVVATYIKRVDPGFSPETYGHEKFSMLVKSTGLFVYDDSEKTNHKIKIQEKPGNNNK